MFARRWVRLLIVGVVAIAAGALAGAWLSAAWAGGVGIGVGLTAALVLEWWADRHVPDFVAIFEDGLE